MIYAQLLIFTLAETTANATICQRDLLRPKAPLGKGAQVEGKSRLGCFPVSCLPSLSRGTSVDPTLRPDPSSHHPGFPGRTHFLVSPPSSASFVSTVATVVTHCDWVGWAPSGRHEKMSSLNLALARSALDVLTCPKLYSDPQRLQQAQFNTTFPLGKISFPLARPPMSLCGHSLAPLSIVSAPAVKTSLANAGAIASRDGTMAGVLIYCIARAHCT